ncbi:unnamed protein product [Adineta ricciae]|uniref:Beta-1,4-galactosyltransferase n=1 Tax=Adineta ricciae TaxID=249248 RepID=A0A815M7L3_ADIRI|nr:unnamed protein product [Adineta ricciae]
MFYNRRTVFLFICSIVFFQALYYIITLQLKKNQTISPYDLTSDKEKLSFSNETILIQKSEPSFISTTSIQTLVPSFIKATYVLAINLTRPDPVVFKSYPVCNFSISNNDTSIYRVTVSKTIHSFDVIEKHHEDIDWGGHWFPKTCRTEQRLALIICYRNREFHLKLFLDNIHSFLKQQQLDYTIFVVNQHGTDQFNRAALFNVGFLEAMKLYSFDCFIFHDVDLIPEDLRNVYKCGDRPRHMSVAVDKFNYKLLYSTLFGGVTAFSLSDFIGANGYPTVYWGWGGEDDDMYLRVSRKLKKSITRYPIEIARYKMIRTYNHTSGKANPHRHDILYSKYDYNRDGINTTRYNLHELVFYKTFTMINVTLTEERFEQISARLNITKRKPAKKSKTIRRKP